MPISLLRCDGSNALATFIPVHYIINLITSNLARSLQMCRPRLVMTSENWGGCATELKVIRLLSFVLTLDRRTKLKRATLYMRHRQCDTFQIVTLKTEE